MDRDGPEGTMISFLNGINLKIKPEWFQLDLQLNKEVRQWTNLKSLPIIRTFAHYQQGSITGALVDTVQMAAFAMVHIKGQRLPRLNLN